MSGGVRTSAGEALPAGGERAEVLFRGEAHVVFAGDSPQGGALAWSLGMRARDASPRVTAREQPLAVDEGRFYEQMLSAAGVEVRRYRAGVLRRRHDACLRAVRAANPQAAAAEVAASGASAERAAASLLIGVTSFFRDSAVFAGLAGHVEEVWQASRGGVRRALSVGCSDGSELYSLAVILAERGLLSGSELWGVDCRGAAVAHAARGEYSAAAVEGVDEGVRGRWFSPAGAGGAWRVDAGLRSACRWVRGDAFALPAEVPGAFDLVMCRNLAIYLRPEAAEELWRGLAERVRPGGLLVVGKAERPAPSLGLVRVGPCLFRKGGA